MKTIFAIILSLLLPSLVRAVQYPTITAEGAVSGTNANATTVATSTGISTPANALVLVGVGYSNTGNGPTSIAASSGTITFTKVFTCPGTNTAGFDLWQGYTVAGLSSSTITATLSATTFADIIVESFVGAMPAVGNSNCQNGAGTTFTSASVTSSSHNNSLYVQWINTNKPSSTLTASSGYFLDASVTVALKLNTADYLGPYVTPPATQTITGSQSVSGDYSNAGVELIAVGGNGYGETD